MKYLYGATGKSQYQNNKWEKGNFQSENFLKGGFGLQDPEGRLSQDFFNCECVLLNLLPSEMQAGLSWQS